MPPMVMMPPVAVTVARPEVEMEPWAVVVPAIPVSWAMPMAAMPVAPVPDLLNVRTLGGYWLEFPCYAGRWRSLSR